MLRQTPSLTDTLASSHCILPDRIGIGSSVSTTPHSTALSLPSANMLANSESAAFELKVARKRRLTGGF